MLAIFAFVLAMSIKTGVELEKVNMEHPPFPGWTAGSDEQISSDSAGFAMCDEVIRSYAAQLDQKVSQIQYYESKRWGRIARAELSGEYMGRPGSTFVTCWATSDSGVEIAVKGASFRD
jgi:hypothetical protein